MSNTRTYESGGGKYTATQNADGTWNLLDVPICGEVPKGEKGAREAVDGAWLAGAVKKHLEKFEAEKYLPPLHINHHGTEKATIPAGHFLPRRVGKLQYEGKTSNAIFADLTNIPAEVFAQIEAGKLPYISVELGSWEDGRFTSCSLLTDDAPYFSFPNVTVGTKVHSFTAEAERIAQPSVAVAFRATGTDGRGMVLCKAFTGVKLADEDEDEKKDEAAEEAKPESKDESGKPAMKDGSKDPDVAPAGGEVTLADIATLLQQMQATLTILAKSQTGVGTVAAQSTDTDENKAPVDQEPPMDEKEKKLAAESEVKLGARIAALETERDERKKQDAVKALAAKYEAELKGYHLSDATKAALLKAAERGEDMVKLFADTFKATAPKEPPATFAAFEAGSSTSPTVDPEAEKVLLSYQARGPEALEQARRFVEMHAESKRRGMTTLSVDAYVAAQFRGMSARVMANGRA